MSNGTYKLFPCECGGNLAVVRARGTRLTIRNRIVAEYAERIVVVFVRIPVCDLIMAVKGKVRGSTV